MLQELFRIPYLNIPVYGYGFMLVIGFLAATQLAKFLARRMGLDGEVFVNAALLALFTGILGARLSHVLENLADFTNPNLSFWQNLVNALNIRSGGLTYYGGFLLAFPVLVLYALWKKVPLRLGMDIIAPCLMIGLAFGRIGCFLNGCCYGAECHNVPWAVQFPYLSNAYVDQVQQGNIHPPTILTDPRPGHEGQFIPKSALDDQLRTVADAQHSLPVHPAQLYSSLSAFLIAGLLLAYFTLPHATGRAFALMLLLYPAIRFLEEMLRVEPPVLWVGHYGLSLSMVISIPLEILGIVLWILFGRLDPHHAADTGINSCPAS